MRWKTVPAFMRGDWRSRAVAVAQVATGFVALVGLLGMLTRNPLLLLGFSAVQGLLLQVRRDAVGSNRAPFLENRAGLSIAPPDVDHLAATLQHKLSSGRLYLT